MPMYFEDFEVGQRFVTAGRTVTEADVVNFAGVSGDYNPIHTDAEFAKSTPFGQRIAHGLLVLSMLTGLRQRTGATDGTLIAWLEIRNYKFLKPVLIGDTVRGRARSWRSGRPPSPTGASWCSGSGSTTKGPRWCRKGVRDHGAAEALPGRLRVILGLTQWRGKG